MIVPVGWEDKVLTRSPLAPRAPELVAPRPLLALSPLYRPDTGDTSTGSEVHPAVHVAVQSLCTCHQVERRWIEDVGAVKEIMSGYGICGRRKSYSFSYCQSKAELLDPTALKIVSIVLVVTLKPHVA